MRIIDVTGSGVIVRIRVSRGAEKLAGLLKSRYGDLILEVKAGRGYVEVRLARDLEPRLAGAGGHMVACHMAR